ncbi:TetR/AcrR family transcriptional regulator [Streptomyces sp. NPDC059009]|uniref:TetR/AcrR family transcriptional regulator n=1 Tax=Streptomyces sp. NPDC059009 TaxID=3346694 RepID=UPI0036B4D8AA
MTPARRRLSPDARAHQLLDVGAELFAEKPYDDVLMEEVAVRAGVSRALLYRHFPGKRELFAAVYRQAAGRLLAATELDPGTPPSQWLKAGLDAHIDYFAANRHTVLAANRGLAGDQVIQGIINDELDELRRRVLVAIGLDAGQLDAARREMASAAVMSWLVFVRALCVDWLTHHPRGYTRTRLRDIAIGALTGALGPITGDGPPAALQPPR